MIIKLNANRKRGGFIALVVMMTLLMMAVIAAEQTATNGSLGPQSGTPVSVPVTVASKQF